MNGTKVDTQASFALFVYPFLFDKEKWPQLPKSISQACFVRGEKKFDLWEATQFPEDDLLAHVKDYLNPREGTEATAYLWRLKHDALVSTNCFGAKAQWHMAAEKIEVPFQFADVKLALFCIGLGFLTLEISLPSEEERDWLNFLHYFRFADGKREVFLKAKKKQDRDEYEPYVPPLAGDLGGPGERPLFLKGLIQALLNTAKGGEDSADWWREVFIPGQLIPFSSLYVDGTFSDDEMAGLLYRVRNFFPAQRVIVPSPQDMRLEHPMLLPYVDKCWFMFSHEGGAFVAVNAPNTHFFRVEMPNHLKEQYFLLFLLALQQKFALMRLSQDVSENWLKGDFRYRARSFELIRNDFLDFTARGCFFPSYAKRKPPSSVSQAAGGVSSGTALPRGWRRGARNA